MSFMKQDWTLRHGSARYNLLTTSTSPLKELLFALLWLLPTAVQAAPSVTVIESWPAQTQAVLTVEQHFWVRLKYESPSPLRIYVRPYLAGTYADAISHAATLLPAGSGETLGWFAMREPGMVDEYRVSYAEQDSGQDHHQVISVPVRLTWMAGTVKPAQEPEWIPRLRARMDELHRIEMANMPETAWYWTVIGVVVLFGVPIAAVAASWRAFRHWGGAWRFLGGAPLLLLAFWVLVLIASWAVDPTSHNLFPFEILIWAAGSLAWLALLWVVRKLRKIGSDPDTGSDSHF